MLHDDFTASQDQLEEWKSLISAARVGPPSQLQRPAFDKSLKWKFWQERQNFSLVMILEALQINLSILDHLIEVSGFESCLKEVCLLCTFSEPRKIIDYLLTIFAFNWLFDYTFFLRKRRFFQSTFLRILFWYFMCIEGKLMMFNLIF